MKRNRRDFLRGIMGASAGTLWGSAGLPGVPALARDDDHRDERKDEDEGHSLPPPHRSGIEHIVVVMMENRSFDHLLGWHPNADGRQAGLTYVDNDGVTHGTYALALDFTGCPHPDPDHSYEGGRAEYDDSAMDGFLRAGSNDEFAIGYYVEEDRPFYNALVRHYTTLDRCFCSILGPTFPNRIFLHAAQTDRLSNTFELATVPTIWDRLLGGGVSALYYYQNLPFLGLWGLTYLPISRFYAQFLDDAASGNLPAVSFLDPRFTISDDGTGNDDHPHADIRAGDAFLAETFHAVANGPAWRSTVFVITYDEWGGFFDHVSPPRVIAPNQVDPDLVRGRALLGFRVPVVVASPFTRGEADEPRVSGRLFDHTSILKLIEWRWGLAPLTARDASSEVRNLALALNFRRPHFDVPDLPTPSAPPPQPCLAPGTGLASSSAREASRVAGTVSNSVNAWTGFRDSGVLEGWPLDPGR